MNRLFLAFFLGIILVASACVKREPNKKLFIGNWKIIDYCSDVDNLSENWDMMQILLDRNNAMFPKEKPEYFKSAGSSGKWELRKIDGKVFEFLFYSSDPYFNGVWRLVECDYSVILDEPFIERMFLTKLSGDCLELTRITMN